MSECIIYIVSRTPDLSKVDRIFHSYLDAWDYWYHKHHRDDKRIYSARVVGVKEAKKP